MYLDFYGLREPPFSITPDPRFVFLSDRHRDALAHLLYGIGQGGGGGFVQLTGEVGTGKTTLCRLLLEQLPENTRVALVLNPKLSPIELLETICEELRLDISQRRGSLKGLVDALNAYLLEAYAQGLRVVLIIDEAQNLSTEALEQVRLLTNLETPTQKLLQIILLGQPELREMLARPELRQLAQRITARYHLTPLDAEETEAYLRHRLAVAGSTRFPFTKLAIRKLHEHSGGVPRLINVIADRALVGGYAQDLAQIGERHVERAATEALASPIRRWGRLRLAWVAALIVAVAVVAVYRLPRSDTTPEDTSARPAAAGTAGSEASGIGPQPSPAGDADEPAIDFGERVRGAGATSRLTAWNRLLSLWTVRADEADVRSAARCPLLVAPGIYCLRGAGSLAKLASLRRPVILRVQDDAQEAWAVLLGVSSDEVRLALAGETFDLPRHELERHWLGEYYALWRTPVPDAGTLRRGDIGPSVDWLRDRLIATDHLSADATGPARYDDATEAAVRRLQTAHGLVPDGIVGPETLFALTARVADGPRLRRTFK
jgi:general secretion pathway protein A